jgi:hypothetical protein
VLDFDINALKDPLAKKCASRASLLTGNGDPQGAQMILFPLMTTWMWFQIFTASPLPSSGRPLEARIER